MREPIEDETLQLRDRFAITAMLEFIRRRPHVIPKMTPEKIANLGHRFYAVADAMMIARVHTRRFRTTAELDAAIQGGKQPHGKVSQ